MASQPPQKKPRTGYGSSVANLEVGEQDDLILVMSKIKVERLLPKGRKVITINRNDSLPEAFKQIVENNVLSLPVLNQNGKYYGIIEILDVVRFVADLFSDLSTTRYIDLESLLSSESKFSKAKVSDVAKFPRTLTNWNKLHPLSKGYSLLVAWETLSLGGIHRVPILDENNNLCDIITQSMLIDFLWQNIEKIGNLANLKIEDMKTTPVMNVISISSTTKTVIAFREMVRKQVNAVAVVDANEKLVDNLSLRDLRGIRPDVQYFWRLWSSVTDFKEKVKNEFPNQTPNKVIYALPSDTLYSVVEKMVTYHIHRVFVVDSVSSMKPTAVISQTDILREILGR